jgi:hypothetical protein
MYKDISRKEEKVERVVSTFFETPNWARSEVGFQGLIALNPGKMTESLEDRVCGWKASGRSPLPHGTLI